MLKVIICIGWMVFFFPLSLGYAETEQSLPDGIDATWWSKASQGIMESEYEIRWQDKYHEFQSSNRIQNLRFNYYLDGFKVEPRIDQEKWSVDIRLNEFGRQNEMKCFIGENIKVEKRKGYVKGNGVDIEYNHSEEGMREDFIVHNRLKGDGELILEFYVRLTNVEMVIQEDCIGFTMDVAGGSEVFRYSDLRVYDNDGSDLKGYFISTGKNRFAIIVDDRDAKYPIRIDPLSSTPDWMGEANQAEAVFGISVGTAGDVNGDGYSDVIVGALLYDNGQTDEGAAFVYHGSASGLSITPDWTGEVNQADAFFGGSVATAGDVNGDGYSDVIVGASHFYNGQTNEGCAFVYHGSASGLSITPDWTGEVNQADAFFGGSVATAGDVNGDGYSDVIIGATHYWNSQNIEGAAFVFYGSASGLSTTPDWIGEGDRPGNYGGSVGTAGDVNSDGFSDVIVGAFTYNNGLTYEGAAFVYHGSASGLSSTPDWMDEGNQVIAFFGYSVSTAGDVNGDGYSDVIVGVYNWTNGLLYEGAAFVYYGSVSGLSSTPDWIAEGNQADAHLGCSVSMAGDVNGDGYSDVLVGASYYDSGQTDEGCAFVYYGSASGLSSTPDWTGQADQAEASFGISIGAAGDVNGDGLSDVIVGAYYYDNGQTDEGAAFVYYGSASGLSSAPDWTAEGNLGLQYFGISVGTAGDVNGDGYSDIIVGANRYNSFEGAVFAFYGSASGLSTTPDWMGQGNQGQNPASFGSSIGTAGDVNGDGYSDIIVGAPNYSNGHYNEGAVFVFYGSASGLSSTPDWAEESNSAFIHFGGSVATAGDVNGDGYSDVIIGAFRYENYQFEEGAAFVYHGSASGLSSTPDWMNEGNQNYAEYGISVGTAGDINGDGYSDVIVGAWFYDNGQANEGAAFAYHGSASGLSSTADWIGEGEQASALLGGSVATAGDVNGDGYSDVIVGVSSYTRDQANEGAAFVFYGSVSGLSSTPDWIGEGNQASSSFGGCVGTAGDVNGDGYSDVIIGARLYDSGQSDAGAAFVYYSSASGLSSTPDWTAEFDQANAWFGYSVGTAGDVNGDGYSDIIAGSPLYDSSGMVDRGTSVVYHGNENRSVIIHQQQLRSDFTAHIVPALFTNSNNSFGLRFWGRSYCGRVLAKAQIEVKQLGIPFNSSGFIETEWLDLDTIGMQIEQVINSGLVPNSLYKWRARMKYHPKYGLSIHSRWYYIQSNGMTECDLRVGIESGVKNNIHSVIPPDAMRLGVEYMPGGIRFRFSIPDVQFNNNLVIYDLLGAKIDKIPIPMHVAGKRQLEWFGRDKSGNIISSGVYFARIVSGQSVSNSVKFVLVK